MLTAQPTTPADDVLTAFLSHFKPPIILKSYAPLEEKSTLESLKKSAKEGNWVALDALGTITKKTDVPTTLRYFFYAFVVGKDPEVLEHILSVWKPDNKAKDLPDMAFICNLTVDLIHEYPTQYPFSEKISNYINIDLSKIEANYPERFEQLIEEFAKNLWLYSKEPQAPSVYCPLGKRKSSPTITEEEKERPEKKPRYSSTSTITHELTSKKPIKLWKRKLSKADDHSFYLEFPFEEFAKKLAGFMQPKLPDCAALTLGESIKEIPKKYYIFISAKGAERDNQKLITRKTLNSTLWKRKAWKDFQEKVSDDDALNHFLFDIKPSEPKETAKLPLSNATTITLPDQKQTNAEKPLPIAEIHREDNHVPALEDTSVDEIGELFPDTPPTPSLTL